MERCRRPTWRRRSQGKVRVIHQTLTQRKSYHRWEFLPRKWHQSWLTKTCNLKTKSLKYTINKYCHYFSVNPNNFLFCIILKQAPTGNGWFLLLKINALWINFICFSLELSLSDSLKLFLSKFTPNVTFKLSQALMTPKASGYGHPKERLLGGRTLCRFVFCIYLTLTKCLRISDMSIPYLCVPPEVTRWQTISIVCQLGFCFSLQSIIVGYVSSRERKMLRTVHAISLSPNFICSDVVHKSSLTSLFVSHGTWQPTLCKYIIR